MNNFEKTPIANYPRRTRAILGMVRHALYGQITLEGAENLALARTGGAVIACSHRTDQDMVAAACALAPQVEMGVATMSVNFERPLERSFFWLAGGDQVLHPVSYRTGADSQAIPRRLTPRDYSPMCRSIAAGKSIMVAAHNPSRTGQLPLRAGRAAPYLALRSSAPVIPVSVEFRGQRGQLGGTTPLALGRALLGHPDIRIACGEPFILTPAPSRRILRGNHELTFSDLARIRQGGDEIMQRIRDISRAP